MTTPLSKQAYEARLANRAIDLDEMKRTDPEFKARWERLTRKAVEKAEEPVLNADSGRFEDE